MTETCILSSKSVSSPQKSQTLEPELCQAEITDLGIVHAIQYDVGPERKKEKTGGQKHGLRNIVRSWPHKPRSDISRHIPNSLIQNQITLLRVIPTMTFQNNHVRFYVSLIVSGEGKHTTHLLKCLRLPSTSQTAWRQSFDILSDISSDILSGILSDILSGILSDISSDILSDISCDTLSDISSNILSDILSDISCDILSDISSDILSDISCDILSDLSADILSGFLSDPLSDIF